MDGRYRVIIEGVSPEVDGGRFPAKTIVGDTVNVEADIYADGHDTLSARLLYRRKEETDWQETPMRFLVNDRWRGSFIAGETGSYIFTITAWVDRFKSWCQDLKKRVLAGQKDLSLNLLTGAQLISEVKPASFPYGQPNTKYVAGHAELQRGQPEEKSKTCPER